MARGHAFGVIPRLFLGEKFISVFSAQNNFTESMVSCSWQTLIVMLQIVVRCSVLICVDL